MNTSQRQRIAEGKATSMRQAVISIGAPLVAGFIIGAILLPGCMTDNEAAEQCCEAIEALSPVRVPSPEPPLSPTEAVALAAPTCDSVPPEMSTANGAAWQLGQLALDHDRWHQAFCKAFGNCPGNVYVPNRPYTHTEAVESVRQAVLLGPGDPESNPNGDIYSAENFIINNSGSTQPSPPFPSWVNSLTPDSDPARVLEKIGHFLEARVYWTWRYDLVTGQSWIEYTDSDGDEGAAFAVAVAEKLGEIYDCGDPSESDSLIAYYKDPSLTDWTSETDTSRIGWGWLKSVGDFFWNRLEDIGDFFVQQWRWINDNVECILAEGAFSYACATCLGPALATSEVTFGSTVAACGLLCAVEAAPAIVACWNSFSTQLAPGDPASLTSTLARLQQ